MNDRTTTQHIRLTKHHGLGNDFLIAVDPDRPLTPDDARAWCDRRTGVGADGLIVAVPVGGAVNGVGGSGSVRHWRMTMWNADGSQPELSGNGLRCLGQAIAEHQHLDPGIDQQLTIDTDAGTRPMTVLASAQPGPTASVRVGMGKAVEGPAPSQRWAEVSAPITGQRGVDVGNPHLVGFVDDLGSADMADIGPVIEADYPSGLNVHLVAPVDTSRLRLRVWERGVGVTQACGSGAVAAAWAANASGLVGEQVTVDMPGGSVEVELGTDEIHLTGPTVRVAEVLIHG